MIAGCIVLYNPGPDTLHNINSYVGCLDQLYVVDNSDNKNNELIDKLLQIPQITYVNNNGNNGIAMALNIGCEYAVNAGYNWVLTMDQDSFFISDTFFNLFRKNIANNIGIYAASYTNEYDRWVRPYNDDFNEIHFVVTSGNILNLNAWKKTGPFEEKLFIDEVDHDICSRLRAHDYKILTSTDLFLKHSVGINLKANDNKKVIEGHSPTRYYYMTRNTLYISKKYLLTDFSLVTNRVSHLSKNIIRIIIYYPEKLQYIKYILKGTLHFLTGKYGKLKMKK